jgi:nucleotide-binding universal stress UspA family protein
MSKKLVLIPVDGSEFSQQIVPHVRRLLHPEENQIVMLRIGKKLPKGSLESNVPAPIVPLTNLPLADPELGEQQAAPETTASKEQHVYQSQREDSYRNELKDEAQEAGLQLEEAGFDVSAVGRIGKPAEEIIRFVEQEDVDLVAMSTHGRSGLSELIFGSVVEAVVASVSVPILLVHPTESEA